MADEMPDGLWVALMNFKTGGWIASTPFQGRFGAENAAHEALEGKRNYRGTEGKATEAKIAFIPFQSIEDFDG